MHTEIEVKLRVESFDRLRRRLAELHATARGCVVETNWFFDRPGRSLAVADKGLRLRTAEPEAGSHRSATLTYKGPAAVEIVTTRPELQLDVPQPQIARQLLLAVGFVEILVYQKRRESWQLPPCSIELDELPHLGRFVEIEGPDPDTIARARHDLNLTAAPTVPHSYLALLLQYVDQQGLSPPHIMLES